MLYKNYMEDFHYVTFNFHFSSIFTASKTNIPRWRFVEIFLKPSIHEVAWKDYWNLDGECMMADLGHIYIFCDAESWLLFVYFSLRERKQKERKRQRQRKSSFICILLLVISARSQIGGIGLSFTSLKAALPMG